jgi:hypothetical protein
VVQSGSYYGDALRFLSGKFFVKLETIIFRVFAFQALDLQEGQVGRKGRISIVGSQFF